MDKIILKGLKLFAYHGVNEEEKRDGQNFIIDIEGYLDLSAASESDRLSDTVSYAAVKKIAQRVFTAQKYDLLEKAAGEMCKAIFREFEPIQRLVVTVYKPEAPMKGVFDYAAVTLDKNREQL